MTQLVALDAAEVARPHSLAEAREALMDGHERALPVLFAGGRTKLAWGRRPVATSRIIDTTRLGRVIAHDPGDMTATVGAGIPLARLQDELAKAGQWLAVDPPLGPGREATVGGIFAAGDSGPRRLRYGSLRELVIGMTVILADGTVARAGGNVIKNVAGYDLCKLFCGSLGTLGLVAELTVRLHPLPAASCTVQVNVSAAAASELGLALMASPLEPAAVEYAGGALCVRFEGSHELCAAQSRRAEALLGQGAAVGGIRVLTGADEAAVWDDAERGHAGSEGETVCRVGALPTDMPAVYAAVSEAANEARVEVALASHVCLGLHSMRLFGTDADRHAQVIERVRARLMPRGAYLVVRRRIEGVDARVSPWGEPPRSSQALMALMRRVKERLDPRGRCAPGRFVGGL